MNPAKNVLFFERKLIGLVGLVVFIDIVDFMMVMPLGPDYVKALNINIAQIGYITGIYTLAACIAGMIGVLFLDSFPRKKIIQFMLFGLACATATGSLAWNLESLMVSRMLAGLFGGPLTSTAFAMLADNIPPERRGNAMGKVMRGFAVASVLGVPFGLELAQFFGWRAPFLGLSLITVFALFLVYKFLPNGVIVSQIPLIKRLQIIGLHFKNPIALATFFYTCLGMTAAFLIIPNIATHLQYNWNYPREEMGLLYLVGGLSSFVSMTLVGKALDKYGIKSPLLAITLLNLLCMFFGFVYFPNAVPVLIIFVVFMICASGRNVCAQALSSQVPMPEERAGFTSMLSVITNLASTLGAFLSGCILYETSDHYLSGMPQVALISMLLWLVIPYLMMYVEDRLKTNGEKARNLKL